MKKVVKSPVTFTSLISEASEKKWEERFIRFFEENDSSATDAAHDLGHFIRVSKLARVIAVDEDENIDPLVLLAAAYFHDIVNVPKDHPERTKASYYSSVKARDILAKMHFPGEKLDAVSHAILSHSYSAGIIPETTEAKSLQDADRLEAIGALGIMRCFYTSGKLGSLAFDPEDLYAQNRPLDDSQFALDHFYVKLLKLPDRLCTKKGREIGQKRAFFLSRFVDELESDITRNQGDALLIANLCHSAGRDGRSLFSFQDPFAEQRALNSQKFILDECFLKLSPASLFINELKIEL